MIKELLNERILILDGAMGTMIQTNSLPEKGYSDMLNINSPAVIESIHTQYLVAGADIIETNTFNSNEISLSACQMEKEVRELNLKGAQIARKAADDFTAKTPDKPRLVAGSVGPSSQNIPFPLLRSAFREQMEALIEGGVDFLLIETSYHLLNTKAALMAAEEAMEYMQRTVPILLSFTISGENGTLFSGESLEEAIASLAHYPLLAIGLNCSFGAEYIKPFLKKLKEISPCYIMAYPNAGLPDKEGKYEETPESFALQVQEYLDESLINIIGGCCGTTPAHIEAISQLLKNNTCHSHKPIISNK